MALTDKQAKFARLVADGMQGAEAAKAAGYANGSRNSLSVTASRLMQHAEVRREIFERREARLAGPLADKAMRCLEGIIEDETAPAAARVKAATFVLESAGHGLQAKLGYTRLGIEADKREPSQMSLAELEAMVARTQERLRNITPEGEEGADSAPILESAAMGA
ncbi:terminase small subunit [Luteolibacter sp. Populi]|uniref:terminase small subunit n=1 Tax=Luteolibacter sp. Populi TaxID=3230487 RepID=UPI003465F9DE